MEKQQSVLNEDLNTAFVQGELNKTLNAGEESGSWNLLDDPNILEDEPNSNLSNILEKESKSSSKGAIFMESSIRFQEKYSTSATYGRGCEQDEDIKDLFAEMSKGMKVGKKK